MRHQRRRLSAAAAELKGLETGVCNIGDRSEIERMVADAADRLGGVDVLVNNAGISDPTAPIRDVDPDQWEHALQVDLTGTFNVTRNAIPHLIASGKGVIILMSSAAGRFGYLNRSPYSTTKWGPIGFMKTLAMELGEYDIRANAQRRGETVARLQFTSLTDIIPVSQRAGTA